MHTMKSLPLFIMGTILLILSACGDNVVTSGTGTCDPACDADQICGIDNKCYDISSIIEGSCDPECSDDQVCGPDNQCHDSCEAHSDCGDCGFCAFGFCEVIAGCDCDCNSDQICGPMGSCVDTCLTSDDCGSCQGCSNGACLDLDDCTPTVTAATVELGSPSNCNENVLDAVSFPLTITILDQDNNPIDFSGSVTLLTTSGATVSPAVIANFTDGVATADITFSGKAGDASILVLDTDTMMSLGNSQTITLVEEALTEMQGSLPNQVRYGEQVMMNISGISNGCRTFPLWEDTLQFETNSADSVSPSTFVVSSDMNGSFSVPVRIYGNDSVTISVVSTMYESVSNLDLTTSVVSNMVFAGVQNGFASPQAAHLEWDAASDATGSVTYNIYYATESGMQDFDSNPQVTTTDLSIDITSLSNNQAYYFVVRAEDSLGEDTNTIELVLVPGDIVYVDALADEANQDGTITYPYLTLSAALADDCITDSMDCTIIRVAGGYYDGTSEATNNLYIPENVTVSAGWNNADWSYDGSSTILDVDDEYITLRNNSTISGFIFNGHVDDDFIVFYGQEESTATISNNTFAFSTESADGVIVCETYTDDTNLLHLNITGNTVQWPTTSGSAFDFIQLYGCSATITNNEAVGSLRFTYSNQGNLYIQGNTIASFTGTAIDASSSILTLIGNIFTDAASYTALSFESFISSEEQANAIIDNTFDSEVTIEASFYYGTFDILNNYFTTNGDTALDIQSFSAASGQNTSLKIENNTFEGDASPFVEMQTYENSMGPTDISSDNMLYDIVIANNEFTCIEAASNCSGIDWELSYYGIYNNSQYLATIMNNSFLVNDYAIRTFTLNSDGYGYDLALNITKNIIDTESLNSNPVIDIITAASCYTSSNGSMKTLIADNKLQNHNTNGMNGIGISLFSTMYKAHDVAMNKKLMRNTIANFDTAIESSNRVGFVYSGAPAPSYAQGKTQKENYLGIIENTIPTSNVAIDSSQMIFPIYSASTIDSVHARFIRNNISDNTGVGIYTNTIIQEDYTLNNKVEVTQDIEENIIHQSSIDGPSYPFAWAIHNNDILMVSEDDLDYLAGGSKFNVAINNNILKNDINTPNIGISKFNTTDTQYTNTTIVRTDTIMGNRIVGNPVDTPDIDNNVGIAHSFSMASVFGGPGDYSQSTYNRYIRNNIIDNTAWGIFEGMVYTPYITHNANIENNVINATRGGLMSVHYGPRAPSFPEESQWIIRNNIFDGNSTPLVHAPSLMSINIGLETEYGPHSDYMTIENNMFADGTSLIPGSGTIASPDYVLPPLATEFGIEFNGTSFMLNTDTAAMIQNGDIMTIPALQSRLTVTGIDVADGNTWVMFDGGSYNFEFTNVYFFDSAMAPAQDQFWPDYNLATGSAGIDQGNPDATYNDTDGSRNDIGAYGGPNADMLNRE